MSGSKSSDAPLLGAAATVPETGDHLLGLTVHSVPLPGAAEAHQEQQVHRTRHGRWKMLAVMLVCAAPVIASYFTYYVVRPEGRRVYGELIESQPALPDAPAAAFDGSSRKLSDLRGQWLLVSVAGGACDVRCEQHLYLQRQLRETLGREKDRVDWVWLVDDDVPVSAALQQSLAKSGATVLRVGRPALAAWLKPSEGHALTDHLYMVDPQGRWMMRFPAGMDREGAVKAKRDVERLLRASSSWDEAGR